MEVTIIGWYGTETIGDRAIFAGLLRILNKSIGEFSIRLGSLYPFYSERTVIEDYYFYQYCARNRQLNISIFDSQNPFELADNIKKSDLLAIGGGPLMDLQEMNMLDYAFSFADRHNIKSVILGCGWGPLKNKEYIDIASRLIDKSSLTIFRDSISLKHYKEYSESAKNNVYGLIDPAFFACLSYLDKHGEESRTEDYIACNYRDVALEGNHYAESKIPNQLFASITQNIKADIKLPVKLVPMHNFFIGGDDRLILEEIKNITADNQIEVIWEPQSLEQTMTLFYNAKACVGMRFHSIVLQTVLNGNNIVVDYTDPKSGKTISMIKQLNLEEKLSRRYLSLYVNTNLTKLYFKNIENINIDKNRLAKFEDKYIELIKSL